MVHVGDVVGGRYRLLAALATGGMGAVWRAQHLELDREVALKTMLVEQSSPSSEKRFRREAQAAAKLRSPHVVEVMDFGVHEGAPYLVMELLEGEDLQRRIERTGPLALDACASILDDVAKAIDLAHDNGVVHRDLKPANIFLAAAAEGETVKVLDFGIAKLDEPTGGSTTGSTLLGSPAYMSPEQVWAEPVGPKSDLWSLAVVALEMVTGTNPFDGGPLARVFDRIIRDDLPRLSDLRPEAPKGLDAFFERALRRKAEDRFATAKELAAAFRDAIAPSREVAALAPTVSSSAPVKRRDAKALLLGAVVAAATIGLGISLMRSTTPTTVASSRRSSEPAAVDTWAPTASMTSTVPSSIETVQQETVPVATTQVTVSAPPSRSAVPRTTASPSKTQAAPPTPTAAPSSPPTAPAPRASVDPVFGIPRSGP